LIKQVKQNLESIIEKIDSLVFWPITWDDSYFLLHELKTTVEQIDTLSEKLEPIYFDDSFWNYPQNKDLVENIEEDGEYVSARGYLIHDLTSLNP
jgi:hypothetical protein